MKIAVFGLGYVGLSNAIMLSQHNCVIGCDISPERIAMLEDRQSPIQDELLEQYLRRDDLDRARRRGPLEQHVREARAVVAHDDARVLEEAHGLGERVVLAVKNADGPERLERGDERPLGALRELPVGREAVRRRRLREDVV